MGESESCKEISLTDEQLKVPRLTGMSLGILFIPRIEVDERYRPWVLKKSLNLMLFHLRLCRRRFSCLRLTKWWPVEPVF